MLIAAFLLQGVGLMLTAFGAFLTSRALVHHVPLRLVPWLLLQTLFRGPLARGVARVGWSQRTDSATLLLGLALVEIGTLLQVAGLVGFALVEFWLSNRVT